MIEKINWSKIVNQLHNAKNRVVLVMPSVHEEWVDVIISNTNKLQILVCIDNSEVAIRNGYGSINGIDGLKYCGADIRECDGLRINFICIDNVAYCLFLESRILSGDPSGFNAIRLEKAFSDSIINEFFPNFNGTIQEVEIHSKISIQLQEEKLDNIRSLIEVNPPEEPDLKRKISTYNTIFQYAELHFEGGNLSSKTISIPSDALPFKDADLKERLKTRLNLFSKEITEKWSELTDLKAEIEKVRKKYLVTCSIRKDKSILKKQNKIAFQDEVKRLQKLAETSINQLQNKVQTAINYSEDTLRNELLVFFNTNIPESAKGLNKENTERQIDKEINIVLSKVKVPNANTLISKMKLEVHYYELTWEDLTDKKFIDWFVKNDLISSEDEKKLANFSNAYSIKK